MISIRLPVTNDIRRKENVATEIAEPIESSPIFRPSAMSGISGPMIRLDADTVNTCIKPNISM
jgi:hypothetical protein